MEKLRKRFTKRRSSTGSSTHNKEDGLDTRVAELERQLEMERRNCHRERMTVARMERQLTRTKVTEATSLRDPIDVVERERHLRLEAEGRLRLITAETQRQRSRYTQLQQELAKMEELTSPLLEYKNRLERLRQEKATITMGYEAKIHQFQYSLSELKQENLILRKELHSFEMFGNSGNGLLQMDQGLPTAVLERIEQLEAEKQSLLIECEQQRRQYEHCLDDVANQVVQALMVQKDLRQEISHLQLRVRELEQHNSTLTDRLTHRLNSKDCPRRTTQIPLRKQKLSEMLHPRQIEQKLEKRRSKSEESLDSLPSIQSHFSNTSNLSNSMCVPTASVTFHDMQDLKSKTEHPPPKRKSVFSISDRRRDVKKEAPCQYYPRPLTNDGRQTVKKPVSHIPLPIAHNGSTPTMVQNKIHLKNKCNSSQTEGLTVKSLCSKLSQSHKQTMHCYNACGSLRNSVVAPNKSSNLCVREELPKPFCNSGITQDITASSNNRKTDHPSNPSTSEVKQEANTGDEGYSTMSSDVQGESTIDTVEGVEVTDVSSEMSVETVRGAGDMGECTVDLNYEGSPPGMESECCVSRSLNPLIEDENDSDILYIPLTYASPQYNRHSYPLPPQYNLTHPSLFRSYSDSSLCLRRPFNMCSLETNDSSWSTSKRDSESDTDLSSSQMRLQTKNIHPLRRSKAQNQLVNNQAGDAIYYKESDDELWDNSYFVQQWLRLDDTQSSATFRHPSSMYDQAEMEDWSYNVSSEDIHCKKVHPEQIKSPDETDCYEELLQCGVGSLPSIQENSFELEEDANECLWNNATYLKDSPNSTAKIWPYCCKDRTKLKICWPYQSESKTFVSPKSDPTGCWSSSERLSCCDSELDRVCCNYSCGSHSKRSSATLSDSGAVYWDCSPVKTHESESLFDDTPGAAPPSIGIDFTRDFYHLVKYESNRSLDFSDGGSLRRCHKVPEKDSIPPPDQDIALQSVLNFIVEQQKYCQSREFEDLIVNNDVIKVTDTKSSLPFNTSNNTTPDSDYDVCVTKQFSDLSCMEDSIISQASYLSADKLTSDDVSTPETIVVSSLLKTNDTREPKQEEGVVNKEKSLNELCTSKEVLEEINRIIERSDERVERNEESANKGMEVDEGCPTGWVHVENNIDFSDPKARANLLDVMLASSGSSSSDYEEDVTPEYKHLLNIHKCRRQKRASDRDLRVRYIPNARPSILGRKDFFVRYGEKEMEAVSSFDFLEEMSTTSLSSIETMSLDGSDKQTLVDVEQTDTYNANETTIVLSDDDLKQTIEQCISDEDKPQTPNFSFNSEGSDGIERLSISDSCAASFSSSNESLPQ